MPLTAAIPSLIDDLDADVDEAIRQAGGQREAIRGLILGQRQILDQIDRSVSTGYVRGRRG